MPMGESALQAKNLCCDMVNFHRSIFPLMAIRGDCVLDDMFPSQAAFLVARSKTEVEEILGISIPSHLRIYHETSTKPS
jgi:hypothetical protein